MLISTALAQAADQAAPGSGMFTTILPLVLIFAVFYFLIIRPQQRKQKHHREMLASIRRGDQIVTGGGIVGNVIRVDRDDNLHVEIAPDVRVRVLRGNVQDVLARPRPIGGESSEEEEDEEEEKTEEASKGEGRR